MPRRVIILDTSVLCCWLKVPGKETAGSHPDKWDHARVADILEKEIKQRSTLVLPLASLIETGNHIAQCDGDRFGIASRLVRHLLLANAAESPWTSFHDQSSLWNESGLQALAEQWPKLAAANMSMGDVTIKTVAEHYATAGFDVVILTGDKGLKAHQPAAPIRQPRRRGGK